MINNEMTVHIILKSWYVIDMITSSGPPLWRPLFVWHQCRQCQAVFDGTCAWSRPLSGEAGSRWWLLGRGLVSGKTPGKKRAGRICNGVRQFIISIHCRIDDNNHYYLAARMSFTAARVISYLYSKENSQMTDK